ncbi:MAG TPA: glycosyltransferase [Solirubrobacteraceae bacterium]|nr:glycosyltransferase [Solirubrobacteraceae bacterium]
MREAETDSDSIIVVGSSTHFLSGVSYYTHRLALALAERHRVGVVLMRKLIPRFLYPGRDRVGADITDLSYPEGIPVVDGIDWYGGFGLLRAMLLIARMRPRTVILQWWTGAVLHSYILLALWARLFRAAIIVEFHEVQDTGEAMVFGVARYVDLASRLLMSTISGAVLHSESDRQPINDRFGIGHVPCAIITHGPFDNYGASEALRDAPPNVVNLLFFGTIRPYKGLEDLVEAFNDLDSAEVDGFWLTVVGETWEGWTGPIELIERSPHRDRITLVNRYLTDEEVGGFLAGADAVVLPYRRSSASGPLHVAMSAGLPVIVTETGGLPEAAAGYAGAIWVPPADPAAIRTALRDLPGMVGRRFDDPSSWAATAEKYDELIARMDPTRASS